MGSPATSTNKLKRYDLCREDFNHAYQLAKIKLAHRMGRKTLYAQDICEITGIDKDSSIIYHVLNGTGASADVEDELLKLIHFVDKSLLPPAVIERMEENNLINGAHPYPNLETKPIKAAP